MRELANIMIMLCEVFMEPALRKAKMAIGKAGLFNKREPLWIQR